MNFPGAANNGAWKHERPNERGVMKVGSRCGAETDSSEFWVAGVPPAISAKREEFFQHFTLAGSLRARLPRSRYSSYARAPSISIALN